MLITLSQKEIKTKTNVICAFFFFNKYQGILSDPNKANER